MRFALPPDLDALVFVALVWAAQTYLLLSFIAEQAVNAPHYDEWEFVPALTGHQPVTLQWLWSQHNEHRVFLTRLAYLAVEKLARCDFRAGVFFNGALLSVVSVACCAVARRKRGQLHYSDAFFPLLMLHWGQAENLLGSVQIVFVLGAVMCVLTLLLLLLREEGDPRGALAVPLSALAMSLIGGQGIALVPAFGLCGLIAAFQLRQAGHRPRVYGSVAALACASFVLLGLYFVDYVRPAKHPVSPSVEATLRAALQFLASGLGSGQKAYWPLGGYVLAFVTLPCLAVLGAALLREPAKRLRVLSLLLFMGGMAALALGIGWARAVFYADGLFVSRYVTLALPFLCAVYFSWEIVRPTRWANFMQVFMFAALAIMVLRNRDDGYADALALNVVRRAFRADIDNRMPISQLAQKHCHAVYYVCDGPALADRIRMLREYGVPGFAQLPD